MHSGKIVKNFDEKNMRDIDRIGEFSQKTIERKIFAIKKNKWYEQGNNDIVGNFTG